MDDIRDLINDLEFDDLPEKKIEGSMDDLIAEAEANPLTLRLSHEDAAKKFKELGFDIPDDKVDEILHSIDTAIPEALRVLEEAKPLRAFVDENLRDTFIIAAGLALKGDTSNPMAATTFSNIVLTGPLRVYFLGVVAIALAAMAHSGKITING